MYLDPSSVFVPGDNTMYVVTSGGIVRVQGNDVHRLHTRLQRPIERARSVDDLLAAVPATQAPVVGSYLTALRDARVLMDAPPRPAPATAGLLSTLGAAVPRLDVHDETGRILISLHGAPAFESTGAATRICFVRLGDSIRALCDSRLPRHTGRTIYVVVEDGDAAPGHEECERRAHIARWLLLNDRNEVRRHHRCQIYRLHPSGDMSRVAALDQLAGESLREVLASLSLLNHLDVDQAPLVTLSLSMGGIRWSACGVNYDAVSSHLLRRAIATVAFDTAAGEQQVAHRGSLAGALATYRRAIANRAAVDNACVAGSWRELRLQALERYLVSRAHAARTIEWFLTDLLGEPSGNAVADYLQGVARLRIPKLHGTTAHTPDGLWRFRCGDLETASFIRAKALADLLLAFVWREFYARSCVVEGGDCAIASRHSDFVDEAAVERLAGEALQAPNDSRTPLTVRGRAARCWQTVAWVGDIDSAS